MKSAKLIKGGRQTEDGMALPMQTKIEAYKCLTVMNLKPKDNQPSRLPALANQ